MIIALPSFANKKTWSVSQDTKYTVVRPRRPILANKDQRPDNYMAQSKDDDTENNKGQTLPAWPGLPPAQGKDGPDAMKAMLCYVTCWLRVRPARSAAREPSPGPEPG